ncbi:unnamed protein product [Heligmosomoides polygyrus]|uniref:Uncharacterized protein n=1 Tax=Heligmosomoides polygyrus TaxID=6339 RepID=A0A3P8EB77_HELPZ|nr:unnamed protein product [Heligmosomoides polygyrus]
MTLKPHSSFHIQLCILQIIVINTSAVLPGIMRKQLCLCQQFFVFPWPMLLARCEPVQRSILSFQMVDRLFLEAYPRDEYQINSIKERFACEFETHEVLVQFDLQQPCIPKMKNSLFPTYTVLMLLFIDILPFLYAIFTYAWDAWIKNSKLFRNARKRVELNNSRRVPFPKHNEYEPPSKYAPKLVEV